MKTKMNKQRLKMKINWFELVIGIAWLIMAFVFYIRGNELWTIIIMVIFGIVNLLKSCFRERMRIRR